MTAIQRSAIDEMHATIEQAVARAAGALTVRERPFETHVSVRMEPTSAPAVEARLRIAVPRTPGTWTMDEPAMLRLGPDEWLVVAQEDTDVETNLRAVLTGDRDAIVDVSDQRTTFQLAGPRARGLLAMGCSLDLHPQTFGPGRCAETLLARAGVTILQLDDAPTFRLLLRRSYAAYFLTWLLDAIAELDDGFAVPSVPRVG